jgi:hypothetical protein
MIKVICVDHLYFTVMPLDGTTQQQQGAETFELEPWPLTRAQYHRKEWFRYFGCAVEEEFDFER